MARKKYNHNLHNETQPSVSKQKKNQPSIKQKYAGWVVVVLIGSLIINLYFLGNAFFFAGRSLNKMEIASSKAAFTVSNPVTLKDRVNTKDSFHISIAEIWDNRMQRALGYTVQFPIPNFPDGTVILDAQMAVYSVNLMNSFSIKGSKAYTGAFFRRLQGMTIEHLVGNNGIFQPDEEDLTIFAEHFKDSFLRAFTIAYRYVNGSDAFDQLFPNGVSLASVGDQLKAFQATDMNGQRWTLQDLYGKKTALIYVDVGCGTCKSKCGTIRDLLVPSGIDVIFITDASEEDSAKFVEDYARNQPVIFDSDKSLANLLYLGSAPYLMFVDTDLTIRYKSAIDSIVDDVEPALEEFLH
ncbi:MAG: redoxin domain-containing protein [Caldisericia bacterium]|nr:redoxin domain-containing protein [Caldisericia bacterium]MDD4614549.1 redoxin domain-containing protein [Caldisericia bacterium]